jgi:curli production assembly/transport component CsgF
MKTIIIIGALVVVSITGRSNAAELVHQFYSPSFSGIGYSSHVLTIEQMEAARTQKNNDTAKAQQDKAERDARNTNLAKFLVNVESRIYAQLSKQLADAMFAEGGGNSGAMDFQGTSISWIKSASDVTLTITEAGGGTTQITVPIASFAF